MRTTLLDMLLTSGLLTPSQCDEALQNRVFFGGRIGTNLIELGFIDEETLARFLSRQLEVPYSPPERLLNIQPEIIDLIPADLAAKYRVIPLSVNKSRLELVMTDASDLRAIDEIAFISGYVVRPLVAPEIRLIQALGKYYRFEIDPRYRQIIERIEIEPRANSPVTEEPKEPPVTEDEIDDAPPAPLFLQIPSKAPTDLPPPLPESVETELELPLTAAELHPKTLTPQFSSPILTDDPLLKGCPIELPPLDETVTFLVPPNAERQSSMPPENAEDVPRENWTRLARQFSGDLPLSLAWAKDREEVADAVMDYLNGRFERIGFFLIRDQQATGWVGRAGGRKIEAFHHLRLPLTRPSTIRSVVETSTAYVGPLPKTALDDRVLMALGAGRQQSQTVILPLAIGDRTVAVLLVQGGDPPPAAQLQELQKLVRKVTLAFEILIAREKLLQT